ncbi:MAG: tRNA (adenosine(37)-N6)-threonylcarbamoyltransferase complex ATPase subunit type 1 TsaE [Oscillospiraceae bacterium]|nr:tRNA (adenosine(37)-N6)-threonylcarbamoyltransferase complex ATPase subunit type 1 TsaE [Oscillospiraceae bacterium]MCI9563968.1 tRNA (adenosine(37)-N6)-threonylcarbamoyltransferase complex ATPase subunit type 1 TsaE [Oscillospiraceae bacterium]
MDYLTHNEIETEALGETLARRLGPGDVVAYRGDLGAGKTAFTRGLARGLGCTGRVTSPTFTVVNEYEGRLPLFHFDLYRLEGEDALYDIGWEDYLDRGGVCAVEWSERAEAALPRETVWVSIRRCAESEDWRRITIEGRAGDEAAGP